MPIIIMLNGDGRWSQLNILLQRTMDLFKSVKAHLRLSSSELLHICDSQFQTVLVMYPWAVIIYLVMLTII